MAVDIGWQLSKAAIWYENRCTWLGAKPGAYKPGMPNAAATYGTLDPDMYSGTSGVALFLAQLYGATNDVAARCTALGAIRQSLSRLDSVPPSTRLGLYTGWMGIAPAAARVGKLLAEEWLLECARDLVRRCASELSVRYEFDLLSGASGAIVAPVGCPVSCQISACNRPCGAPGNDLLLAAERSDAGLSWKRLPSPHDRNLTGFSHGAAGPATPWWNYLTRQDSQSSGTGAEAAFNMNDIGSIQ